MVITVLATNPKTYRDQEKDFPCLPRGTRGTRGLKAAKDNEIGIFLLPKTDLSPVLPVFPVVSFS